jgi:transcription antitermination factor NusA-like protein
VSRVIGENGKNAKELSSILTRKIKIVSLPSGLWEARKFVSDIISPLSFKNLEVAGNEIIITANKENKAALIGRNKTRLLELNKIVEEYFGKQLKIV